MSAVGDFFGGLAQNIGSGISEVFGRPGDIINNPAKFFGSAASAAAPFLGGPLGGMLGTAGAIPGWASGVMGMGGNLLSGQGQQQQQQGRTPQWQQYLPYALGAAGLFGGGQGINQLTSPFGVKLFPGGPYPDKGLEDKALQYADLLGGAGKQQLTQAQTGLPALSNMGALGMMPGIIGEQAAASGVTNPFTGQGGTSNPYAIQPYQQTAYNDLAQSVNEGRQSSINNLRTQLASQGINDPRAIAAAEAQINAGHDKQLADIQANFQSQAYQNRQNTLGQFESLIPQLYGAQQQSQQQAFGNAQNLMGAPMGAYENAADRATRMYLYNMLNQGGLLGNLLGYGMNPYQNPLTGQPYQLPGQGQPYLGGTTGGGMSGQPMPGQTPPLETGDLNQPYQGYDFSNPWATQPIALDNAVPPFDIISMMGPDLSNFGANFGYPLNVGDLSNNLDWTAGF